MKTRRLPFGGGDGAWLPKSLVQRHLLRLCFDLGPLSRAVRSFQGATLMKMMRALVLIMKMTTFAPMAMMMMLTSTILIMKQVSCRAARHPAHRSPLSL